MNAKGKKMMKGGKVKKMKKRWINSAQHLNVQMVLHKEAELAVVWFKGINYG
jgi:hypothetical protein